MKKITLLAALLIGSVAISQTVLIDRAQNGSGYYSLNWDEDEVGLYSADSFTLDNAVQIESLKFPGFTQLSGGQVPGDGLFLDFSLYIFPSVNGVPVGNPMDPTGAVLALENLDLSIAVLSGGTELYTNFTVDVTAANGGVPYILPAGEYFISPVPTVELADPNWYWIGSDMIVQYDAMVNDPYDLFGSGLDGWTSITSLQTPPNTFPSFAWTMYGEDLLSVNDNLMKSISTYPNPTTGILNLQTPSNVDVNSVALFDVLGKKVSADYNNGTINMTSLSQGIYLLKVETSAGTLTQKIVKQ